ncbi:MULTISPECIES: transporter substrate-binding domain-containing protein [Pseudoalteromonas]|uniref:transporter substrate-binding domain-containing protein n=1 Tax=Pseudoalteromonas TaxID=53246 RepID=UPI001581A7BF|nr:MULTISPECIES: transporter substrate-binding domain-containing protein [Pseudoalteromonas]MDI4652225.1 transporter substrate-binding domain-containing protein [Pseudoalteromonas shioyasakiensis]NUJ40122.1 transporter substrate-binding domain-containing protein [Pseudoalteromonas sp. 0303]
MCARFFSFMVLVFSSFAVANTAYQETWKITSLEAPPYASSTMANGGDAIALLRDTLAKKSINLEVEYSPWQDAIKKARLSGYLGYYPAWLPEIVPGFIASPTILNSQLAVITTQSNPQDFENLEQLFNEHKVGVVEPYIYPGVVEQVIQSYAGNIVQTANDEELFHLMQTGQINFAITAPKVLNYFAEQQNFPEPKIVTQFTDSPLVIGIRNDAENQAKIALLNDLFASTKSSETNYSRPKKVLLTYIDIPRIAPFKAFMSDVYNDLNIKAQMQPTPARRGVLLLNAGIVDGDIVRSKSNLKKFENIIVVEPNLGIINLVLLCRKSLPCDRDNLYDPNNRIISSIGDVEILNEFDIKAEIMHNEDLSHTLTMLKKGRVDYAIYPALNNDINTFKKDFSVVVLRQMAINTVIHKKHAPLVDEIAKAISARLPELTQQIDNDSKD